MRSQNFADAHCHLADPRFEGRLGEVIAQAKASGITTFIQGGTDQKDWERQLRLKESLDVNIVPVFGVHPWTVARLDRGELKKELEALRRMISGAAGVGEIGLDHGARLPKESRALQLEAFEEQLSIAREADKPIVLHVVKAHQEVLAVLRKNSWPGMRGLVHAFSDTADTAKKYIELSFLLSIGGTVTHKPVIAEGLKDVSLEKILIESDAPDQRPKGWKPQYNEPVAIHVVAAEIAKVKATSPEQVLLASRANLAGLFSR